MSLRSEMLFCLGDATNPISRQSWLQFDPFLVKSIKQSRSLLFRLYLCKIQFWPQYSCTYLYRRLYLPAQRSSNLDVLGDLLTNSSVLPSLFLEVASKTSLFKCLSVSLSSSSVEPEMSLKIGAGGESSILKSQL